MDTSEQYIKMCDCPEIQEQYKRAEVDWGLWRLNTRRSRGCEEPDTVMCIGYGGDSGVEGTVVTRGDNAASWSLAAWLPTQNQLQEMVATKPNGDARRPYAIYRLFHLWITNRACVVYDWSLEQMWLACVMHELHNKTWNGEEWISLDT